MNRGAGQLPTASVNLSFTAVLTNLTDGRQLIEYGHFRNQDQQVIDNGDGTLTIHEKAVGPLLIVGSDGTLFAIDTAV